MGSSFLNTSSLFRHREDTVNDALYLSRVCLQQKHRRTRHNAMSAHGASTISSPRSDPSKRDSLKVILHETKHNHRSQCCGIRLWTSSFWISALYSNWRDAFCFGMRTFLSTTYFSRRTNSSGLRIILALDIYILSSANQAHFNIVFLWFLVYHKLVKWLKHAPLVATQARVLWHTG